MKQNNHKNIDILKLDIEELHLRYYSLINDKIYPKQLL